MFAPGCAEGLFINASPFAAGSHPPLRFFFFMRSALLHGDINYFRWKIEWGRRQGGGIQDVFCLRTSCCGESPALFFGTEVPSSGQKAEMRKKRVGGKWDRKLNGIKWHHWRYCLSSLFKKDRLITLLVLEHYYQPFFRECASVE